MPVGMAVAGLGEIGRLHASNLARRVPGARLVTVVDQLPDLARAVARELEVTASGSYEEVLREREVHAVVIATPTPLHAAMVEQAARAGKHVFCEKPLALDPPAGANAARAADEVCLQVGFQRRFDPDWLAAKRRVDAGELGEVLLLQLTHRNRRPPHGADRTARLGSLFVDMSIHDMDTARWLVGEVGAVHAHGRPGGEDADTAVIVLEFAGGALGVIDNARSAGYGFDCRAELMGRRATLRIGAGQRPVDLELLSSDGVHVPMPADHLERHRAAYLAELEHFVECARSGATPAVGAADALAALELSLAAERSYRACHASR